MLVLKQNLHVLFYFIVINSNLSWLKSVSHHTPILVPYTISGGLTDLQLASSFCRTWPHPAMLVLKQNLHVLFHFIVINSNLSWLKSASHHTPILVTYSNSGGLTDFQLASSSCRTWPHPAILALKQNSHVLFKSHKLKLFLAEISESPYSNSGGLTDLQLASSSCRTWPHPAMLGLKQNLHVLFYSLNSNLSWLKSTSHHTSILEPYTNAGGLTDLQLASSSCRTWPHPAMLALKQNLHVLFYSHKLKLVLAEISESPYTNSGGLTDLQLASSSCRTWPHSAMLALKQNVLFFSQKHKLVLVKVWGI